MSHRRVILTPRPARRRPVPAYQVRRGARPSSEMDDAASSDLDTVALVAEAPVQQDQSPRRTDTEAFDLPVASDDEPQADATPESALTVKETPATEPDVTVADDATDGVAEVAAEDESDGDDYADVVRSVEEAAVRDRGDEAATGSEQTASAADGAAAAIAGGDVKVLTPDEVRRQRAAAGGGGAAIPPGDGVVEAGEEPRPRRRLKRWLIALGIVLGVVVVAALGYVLYIALAINDAFDKAHVDPTPYTVYTVNEQGTPVAVPTEQLAQFLPNWDQKDPVTLLLIGIDYRNGDEEPARSDSIIVMRIDPETKAVTMMSLPRDLLVTIPGYGDDKINAAFAYGEDERTGGGPALLAETISYNLNIQINYFVTVDFSGFRKIIDTLGGITVDVDAPIKDDQYPSEDFGLTRVYFPAGLQSMDGETALRYARTRHGDNDIARSERQQQVLMAMRERGSKLNIDLLLNARSLIESMGDSFRTDLSFNQILALANLARDVDPAGIARVNLWQEGALIEHNPEFDGDAFYMELDWGIAGDLFAEYFPMKTAAASPPATSPEAPGAASPTERSTAGAVAGSNLDIPIIVRDDTSTNTGGAIAAGILEDAGFTTISQEMGVNIAAATTIYDYVSDPATAAAIASQLGLDSSAIVPGSGGTGIVVSVGDDLVASQGP